VGVVSNPTRPLHLKLLYGSAFKAPSPLLLYGVPFSIGDIVGNPNLKPQRVDTVEVQATLEPFKDLLFSTGLAYSRLLNQAEFVQQGFNSIARNLGALEALSWESSVRASYQK
jgi:iron complex outermembrane receptor protein